MRPDTVTVSIGALTAIRANDGTVSVMSDDHDRCEPVWAENTDQIRSLLDVLDAACVVSDAQTAARSDG